MCVINIMRIPFWDLRIRRLMTVDHYSTGLCKARRSRISHKGVLRRPPFFCNSHPCEKGKMRPIHEQNFKWALREHWMGIDWALKLENGRNPVKIRPRYRMETPNAMKIPGLWQSALHGFQKSKNILLSANILCFNITLTFLRYDDIANENWKKAQKKRKKEKNNNKA